MTLSAKSILASSRVNPVNTGVTTDQLLLEQGFLIDIKFDSAQIICYFKMCIIRYKWKSHLIAFTLPCWLIWLQLSKSLSSEYKDCIHNGQQLNFDFSGVNAHIACQTGHHYYWWWKDVTLYQDDGKNLTDKVLPLYICHHQSCARKCCYY